MKTETTLDINRFLNRVPLLKSIMIFLIFLSLLIFSLIGGHAIKFYYHYILPPLLIILFIFMGIRSLLKEPKKSNSQEEKIEPLKRPMNTSLKEEKAAFRNTLDNGGINMRITVRNDLLDAFSEYANEQSLISRNNGEDDWTIEEAVTVLAELGLKTWIYHRSKGDPGYWPPEIKAE